MSAHRFQFHPVGPLRDAELELELQERQSADRSPWEAPTYIFAMRSADAGVPMGRLTLRVGYSPRLLLYAGQLGYAVAELFRGRHFAERATRLILPLAQRHGLAELWITCGPDNPASQRTLARLGARFVETVDVPPDYPLPEGAVRQKCRYRLDLAAAVHM